MADKTDKNSDALTITVTVEKDGAIRTNFSKDITNGELLSILDTLKNDILIQAVSLNAEKRIKKSMDMDRTLKQQLGKFKGKT
jgi:hypothetical protein